MASGNTRKRIGHVALRAASLVAAVSACPTAPEAAARHAAAPPPSSLQPKAKATRVRISHRHRSIVQCVRAPHASSCLGRVADADTAAVIRFERSEVATAALHPARGGQRVVFAHQAGPQEQTIDLAVGEWLLDWLDSEKLERIDVHSDTSMHVALATTSGACELRTDRCELLPGVRERHIQVSELRR